MFRELHIKLVLIGAVFIGLNAFGQSNDTLFYDRYNHVPVVYTDLGFNSAPMKIKFPFSDGISRLRYKNNMNAVSGWGFSYKWFAVRLGLTIPGSLRSVEKYGRTQYFDLGFDFTIKHTFTDVDFRTYHGYAIKNGYRWNDSLNDIHPHEIRKDVQSGGLSINTWWFRSKHFKMQAFRGKTGSYRKDIRSFYTKVTFNVHGINTDDSLSVIPTPLVNSDDTKTRANKYQSVDIGLIPGMAYVKRWKTFQIGGIAGLGFVVQSKFYSVNDYLRGFLGLAPRYDIKFIAGYNVPRYFVMFVADFDNKSIRYNNLSLRQNYYAFKLVGGIRLHERVHKKKHQVIVRNRA